MLAVHREFLRVCFRCRRKKQNSLVFSCVRPTGRRPPTHRTTSFRPQLCFLSENSHFSFLFSWFGRVCPAGGGVTTSGSRNPELTLSEDHQKISGDQKVQVTGSDTLERLVWSNRVLVRGSASSLCITFFTATKRHAYSRY